MMLAIWMETTMSVLQDLSQAELIRMVEALQSHSNGLKVTDKGGISMYGLGRFPVTLYRSQWESLLNRADDLRAFIKANEARLAVKS
jgi:hypothetical protein